MPPFPIPDSPPSDHRRAFGSPATGDAARQIEDKAASLSGFASPALVQLLANKGAGIRDILIMDTAGTRHSLRRSTEGTYYRLCVISDGFVEQLNICGYGPESLRAEMQEAADRAKKAVYGGIASICFVATDGREHLLSAKSPSPGEDTRLLVMLLRWQQPDDTIKS